MIFLRLAIAAGFIGSGILHFTRTRTYERIVPAFLPNHRALVLISGAAEIFGGIGILIPQTRKAAGYGLIALLFAVFPANVFMAMNAADFRKLVPAWLLWARLPLQLVFIMLVARATIPRSR